MAYCVVDENLSSAFGIIKRGVERKVLGLAQMIIDYGVLMFGVKKKRKGLGCQTGKELHENG